MARTAFLGGGKMGEALIGGLVGSGWSATDLAVAEMFDGRRDELARLFPGLTVVAEPASAAEGAETLVVAVKPDDVAAALGAAEPSLPADALVLSIAAGVRIATLESLAPGRPVVRVMPNTPALVRQGASAIAGGSHAGDDHLARAEEILGAVGTVVRVPEEMMDAVTAVSGSGPAYLFFLAEALMAAAADVGLPPEVGDQLVRQTLLGASTLLAESPDSAPADLRAAVTSKGGTTAAAVAVLEGAGVREAFLQAVQAATDRSRELGSQ